MGHLAIELQMLTFLPDIFYENIHWNIECSSGWKWMLWHCTSSYIYVKKTILWWMCAIIKAKCLQQNITVCECFGGRAVYNHMLACHGYACWMWCVSFKTILPLYNWLQWFKWSVWVKWIQWFNWLAFFTSRIFHPHGPTHLANKMMHLWQDN